MLKKKSNSLLNGPFRRKFTRLRRETWKDLRRKETFWTGLTTPPPLTQKKKKAEYFKRKTGLLKTVSRQRRWHHYDIHRSGAKACN